MALFFLVFGLVATVNNLSGKKEAICFLEKRYRGLMVPYFLWSFIYASSLGSNAFIGILYGTNPSLGYAGTNQVLWFLPAMFCSAILFQILISVSYYFKSRRKFVVYIIEIVICSIVSLLLKHIRPNIGIIWGIDISFTGTVLMMIGMLLRPVVDKIYKLKKIKVLILSLICILVGGVFAQFNVPKESWVSIMAVAFYGKSYLLFVALAVISIIGILCVSILIEKCTLFAWLGENSLLLMALHYIILRALAIICEKYCHFTNMITAILCAMFCVIICIPLVYAINKFAPVLKGK